MADIGKNYTKLARNSADLCAFMMVCRHGQLSSAAREMKISQPSLSQRIKNLETALNLQLFSRTSKGVELTREGQNLYRRMDGPLGQVADRFDEFSTTSQSQKVMISVDYAFASFWLLPRLPRMRTELGAMNLCILTSQNPVENAAPGTDIIIRMAQVNQSKSRETLLIKERVSAICSPQFKQANSSIQCPHDLLDHSALLLHLNSPSTDTPWCNWTEWLEHLDVPTDDFSKETVFSNYEMIVRAAIEGQGVALGWAGLVDDLLAGPELTTLLPDIVTTQCGYFIDVVQIMPSRIVTDLQQWIVNEAGISQKSSALTAA
jgi:DNA-binding transcriptional LysR family regulator